MSERFIKYLPNEKAAWLRQHHTALYLLLSLAVERARWNNDNYDGLLAGDAILGNFEEAGISRKQYRDAIDKGIELGIWEVVYNRKCKILLESPKRAIKRTIKCLVVNIKQSGVWDLNINIEGHQKGQERAIKGPSKGHKQEEQEQKEDKESKKEQQPQTPSCSVVVFSCLNKIPDIKVSQDEKMALCRSCPDEERIRIAVECVTAEGFIPKNTLLQSLRAAVRDRWKLNPTKKDNIDINRRHSEYLIKNYKGPYRLELLKEALEVSRGVNGLTEHFYFKDQVETFNDKVDFLYPHKKIVSIGES